MVEYRIVVQNGSARPYPLITHYNFTQCYMQLLEIIEGRSSFIHPEYYVLNDFYDNKYPPLFGDVTKFKIERRDVEEWKMCSEENEPSLQKPKKNKLNTKKSNVIQMFA